MSDITTVAVLGTGVLGSQIAFQTAYNGFPVIAYDIDDAALADEQLARTGGQCLLAGGIGVERCVRQRQVAQGGEVRVVPVKPLSPAEVFNPIGSGDAFLAGMVARLVAAAPASDRHFTMAALADACVFATACAQSNARTARPGFLEDSFALDYRA